MVVPVFRAWTMRNGSTKSSYISLVVDSLPHTDYQIIIYGYKMMKYRISNIELVVKRTHSHRKNLPSNAIVSVTHSTLPTVFKCVGRVMSACATVMYLRAMRIYEVESDTAAHALITLPKYLKTVGKIGKIVLLCILFPWEQQEILC